MQRCWIFKRTLRGGLYKLLLVKVVAALVIFISLDVSVESVGPSFPRVILIGSISVEVLIVTEVEAAAVASPAGVIELNTHSSSEADPSETPLPPASVAPMISPFLCSNDLESDTEIPERHVSPTSSTSEILTDPILTVPSAIVAPSSEFPLALVVASLGIRRRRAIPIQPREDIPIGRLYRTHPGRPCKALTTRKSVRPLTSHRLALRYTSHHLDHFTFGSSSSHSYSDHSLSGHSSLGLSLFGHTPLDTTDVDSSTPPRFVHSPLLGILMSRLLDHLARDRFRDSISLEDSVEEDIDTDMLEDIEADDIAVEVAVDRDVEAGINIYIDIEVDVEDEVKSSDRGTMKVRLDVVARIDIPDCMLMPDAWSVWSRVGGEEYDCWWRESWFTCASCVLGVEQHETLRHHDNGESESDRFRRRVRFMKKHEYHSFWYDPVGNQRTGSDHDNGNRGNGNGGNGNGENGNGKNKNPNENNSDARQLMKLMAEVYYPINEIQKMESKLWNLTVKNNDLATYTQRFQELTMMCTKMVLVVEDRVEKFIGGLPDNIQRNVATEPIRLQDAVRITNNLMDQKLKGYAVKNAENKRRLEVNQRDNHRQYQPFKRPNVRGHNVARAYSTGDNERKPYNGPLSLCNKFEMSRDVLTVGSTMRIPLLYRGEYSQWVERFMNYLEEHTDEKAMINSIKNGDQPLPRVTQVSIAGTTSTEQPPLKDKSTWSDQEKRVQKIDLLERSIMIQGLPNDIYSLIDSNKTAKDLWDALARHMLGSEYGEQDRKAIVLYEYETFKATEGELLLDTYIRYLQVINDLKKCGYSKDKQNQGDVNDAIRSKKKIVVVTSDPLDLIAEKTNVSRSKEKVVVSSKSEGSEVDDFSELKKITALLAKAFNRRKFYSKPTNNNLRTSSSSQSANKKQEFVKTDNKRKDKDEQVLLAKDQAWMESSSDLDQEINANMVFMAQIDENFIENNIDSQKDYDKSDVDHN
nr:hypothetical protein [Tanacetum cinerariifolium]